jgi:hypothetical protein
VLLLLFVH